MKNNIGKLRSDRGWSYDRLADEVRKATGIDTNRQQMMRLEKGHRRLSDVWIERLAAAFKVKPTTLISDELESAIISDGELDQKTVALCLDVFMFLDQELAERGLTLAPEKKREALSLLIEIASETPNEDANLIQPQALTLAIKLAGNS